MANTIVQYIILRGDLRRELKWTTGALVAQACHATAAVTHLFRDDQHMQDYLQDMDSMHKVVLEAPNEDSLTSLAQSLSQANVDHKVWVEQPENIPTCLVIKPYPKTDIQKFVRKFKLFSD